MSSRLIPHSEESSFLDAVTKLMITLDPDLRIQWANRAAGDFVGEEPGNLVGSHCYQVWHARESPCNNCPVLATLWTGEPRESEVASFDGRHWHIRSYPLRSPEGTLKGVTECIQEITERKNAEQALLESERRFHWAMEATGEGIWDWNLLTDEVYYSPAYLTMLGYSQEELHSCSGLQSWSSHTTDRSCTARYREKHFNRDEAGVWVDCIHEGEPVIHNDYASLPHKKGAPQGHPSIVRELVVLVYRGLTIKALLGVGNKPWNYSTEDVESVSLLANLAWDIIERKQMEERFRELSIRDALTGGVQPQLLRGGDKTPS